MMFWERFYELCAEIGKKPNPVGKEIGVSSGAITKWKNGTVPPAEILIKISDYFNCSVDYLLGRAEKQKIASISPDESDSNKNRLMHNYNKMNDKAQEHIADYSDFMLTNPQNLKNNPQNNKMNA